MDEGKIYPVTKTGRTWIVENERQAVIDQTADETGLPAEKLDEYEFEIQEPGRG